VSVPSSIFSFPSLSSPNQLAPRSASCWSVIFTWGPNVGVANPQCRPAGGIAGRSALPARRRRPERSSAAKRPTARSSMPAPREAIGRDEKPGTASCIHRCKRSLEQHFFFYCACNQRNRAPTRGNRETNPKPTQTSK
jgi:hypothetical protein